MASNINADPIDPNFPVAGTNNSTQGFRDNFSNIKNNLNYAKFELTDLQNKAILKSALVGQTLDNDFSESVIANATLKSTSVAISDLGGVTGTAELDFSIASHYLITSAGPVSVSFSNWPTAGICGSLRLVIKITNIAHTLTIPGSVSRGLSNIALLTSNSVNGLSIKPPTKISAGSGTTWTVDRTQSQAVGDTANPVTFTGTAANGTTATFRGYIAGVTLTVLSVTTGTIAIDMTLSESGGLGASTISFALVGDYVFDFETIDHGTSVLILDQSRASNVDNIAFTPSGNTPATTNTLGSIKVGAGLNVAADGTVSTKIATNSVAGVVKVGTGLTGAADGTLSVALPIATAGAAGVVKIGSGLNVAADGTISVSGAGASAGSGGGGGGGGVPSNNSLIFGSLTIAKFDYGSQGFGLGPKETDWTNFGVSIRIPAAGSYRFRVLGALFYFYTTGGARIPGMLRIYVNGVNSSAADITFPTPNLAVVGSGNTDVYRDIPGLQRGDKIELYHKWTTNPANSATVGDAIFTVLIAGENNYGIHALSDYSLSTTKYPGIVVPKVIESYYVDDAAPVVYVGSGGPGSGY